jgi:tryptophanyl-tRNA synthetase
LQKRGDKVVTHYTPIGEPLAPARCHVIALAALFLELDKKEELRERYRSGKEGYGHFKKYLKELIWEEFAEAREKRAYYLDHMDEVREILDAGAKKAQAIANAKMETVREAVGLL